MPSREQIEKVSLNVNEMCCVLAACKTILAAYGDEKAHEEQVVGIKSAISKMAGAIALASGRDMSELESFMFDNEDDRVFLSRFRN